MVDDDFLPGNHSRARRRHGSMADRPAAYRQSRADRTHDRGSVRRRFRAGLGLAVGARASLARQQFSFCHAPAMTRKTDTPRLSDSLVVGHRLGALTRSHANAMFGQTRFGCGHSAAPGPTFLLCGGWHRAAWSATTPPDAGTGSGVSNYPRESPTGVQIDTTENRRKTVIAWTLGCGSFAVDRTVVNWSIRPLCSTCLDAGPTPHPITGHPLCSVATGSTRSRRSQGNYRLLLSHSFSRDFGSAPTCVAAGLPSLNRISVGMPRTA